jgi:putative flippase GtrA
LSETAPPTAPASAAPARRGWRHEGLVLAKASVSSAAATLVDGIAYQAVLFALAGRYGIAAFAGAVLGAITNFTLNRIWAFGPGKHPLGKQIPLYAAASGLVFLGLQGCLTLFIEVLHVNERVAWIPAKGIAWACISYPLFRYVVFAQARPEAPAEHAEAARQ